MRASSSPAREKITSAHIFFGVATLFLVLVAHAIAYLTHEYAHTFVAWGLGWMANPLALDYGHPTLNNIVFLADVDDNVNYAPIFASGHGPAAAVIALAGPFLGNGLLYLLLYRLAGVRSIAGSRMALSSVYWLSLMCSANVWSYVPIRAVATHADIALAAQGLGISTWVLLPFLLVPSLYLVYHFFGRMFPACYRQLSGDSANKLALVIAMTTFWYFSFFVGDAVGGHYGTIAQLLSIASRYLLFPLAAMYLSSRYLASEYAARR